MQGENTLSTLTDAQREDLFIYYQSRVSKAEAFDIQEKTRRVIDFLESIAGAKWNKREKCLVSTLLSRQEALKLALRLPKKAFFTNGTGIAESNSGLGFRVILDIDNIFVCDDPLVQLKLSVSQQDDITLLTDFAWENRGTCVVSATMKRREAWFLASLIDDELFFKSGKNACGLVKSHGKGYRVILDPEKFVAYEKENKPIISDTQSSKKALDL